MKIRRLFNRRVMRISILIAIVCGLETACYGFDFTPRDYSIVPPAPTVSAFMQSIEYPVDYSHGTPNISLPLYTLKSGSIEIPVYLSYCSGGIRVTQKTGNAGLGWILCCGAAISHTVNGAPDDAFGEMHGIWHLNADETSFRNKLMAKQADYDPINGAYYKANLSWEAVEGKRYYEGRTDLANDLFHLNGLGLSATFTLLNSGQIVKSSDQPIKISKFLQSNKWLDGGCDNYGFSVETNNGLTYKFSTQERTKYEFSYGDPLLSQKNDSIYYSSAWHIDKITDLNGNTINYKYVPGKTFIIKDMGHTIEMGYSNPSLSKLSPSNIRSVSSVKYFTQTLQTIEGSGIVIKFDYIVPASSESDAIIKSVTIISPDNKKRVIEFSYSGQLLTEIIDQGDTIYSFDYFLENGSSPFLDHFEQDFGGYPNGSGNYHLIPDVLKSSGLIGRGSDRSVNPEYAVEASLRRITYATGGYTEFEWESNTFSYLGGTEYTGKINSDLTTSVSSDTIRACREMGFEKLKISGWKIDKGQIAEIDMTRYFNMNPANLFGSAYHDMHGDDIYSERNPPHYPHIVIRYHGSSEIAKVYYLDKSTIEPDGNKEITKLQLSPGTYDFELVNPYEVQGAEYFIDNEFRYHDGLCGYVFVRKISTDQLTSIGRQNWCGLRIKRIVSCAGSDENDILRKDFYYNAVGDPDATSGTVQILPRYDYMYYKKFPHESVPGYDGSEIYCVGETAFPQLTIGSFANIEYPEVMTCMGREDRMEPDSYLRSFSEINYFTSSRYDSYRDTNKSLFLSNQPIGSRMYSSKAHWRNNLIRKRYSAYSNTHSSDYAYNIYEDSNPYVLTTDAFPICDFTSALSDNSYGMYDYGIGTYSIIPYTKTLAYEGTSYADGMETYKKYDYFYNQYTDSLDWNLVKSITLCDSEYDKSITHFTYKQGKDYYLPYPETMVTIVDGDVVSAVRTEYDKSTYLPIQKYDLSGDTQANTILSSDQQTTSAQIKLINKPTYEYQYNSRGNLIQISYKGSPLASYIWGYNGLYPIIEATDTDYTSLAAAAMSSGMTKDEIEGNKVYSEAKIDSVAKSIVGKLPNSAISAISYHWLFGVAKITNPRGISSSYSYDSRGRLVEVRDFNNYLINKYDYHYENN